MTTNTANRNQQPTLTRKNNALYLNGQKFASLDPSARDGNCLYSSVANGLRKFGLTISPTELKSKVIEFGKKHAPSDIPYMPYEIKVAGKGYKLVSKTEYFNHHAKASEWGDTIIIETIAQYLGKNICVINQYGYTSFACRINNNKEAIWVYHSGNHFENINTLYDRTLLDSLQTFPARQETNDIWNKEHQYKWAQDNNNLQEAAKYYIQNNYHDAIEQQLQMSGETTSAKLP